MRFFGGLIIGLSLMAAGFMLSSVYGKRVKALERASALIDFIESEIRYCSKEAGEIIEAASASASFGQIDFLKNVLTFEQICLKIQSDKNSALTVEDKRILVDFFSQMGKSDSEYQIKLCRQCVERLKEAENEAKRDERQKTGPARTLSACLCAAVMITVM